MAVEFLTERCYAITGGDVYSPISGRLKRAPGYDCWSLQRERVVERKERKRDSEGRLIECITWHVKGKSMLWDEYMAESRQKAIDYVTT
ncbi:MAG: hypothetical protein M1305_02430 [Candidatus Marsarchaeota archaeon]|nr:hypothetical protein [Candidatus Marsarchaeota archaeon]